MFFNLLKKARRRTGVQLTLWYLAIFTLSSIVVFALTYVLLQSNLKKSDHMFILHEVEDYVGKFQESGFEDMLDEIRSETQVNDEELFFVRIADADNRTFFVSNSRNWAPFNLRELDDPNKSRPDTWSTVSKKNDEDVLEVYSVRLGDGHLLQVGKGTDARNNLLEEFQSISVAVFALTLLVALASSLFLTFHLLAPIRRLIETAHSINQTGRMDARVPGGDGDDELGELTKLINQMLERIGRLVEGMKDSLDNVAHDLRTPLSRMRGIVEAALQSNEPHSVCQEALSASLEEADQVRTMLNTLMDISEAEAGTLKLRLESLDMADIVRDVVDLYQPVADEKNIQVGVHGAARAEFQGDRVRWRQTLANMLDNALKYTPSGGRVDIELKTEGAFVSVIMRDTGIGIGANDLSKIWDRLYRGDQSRSQPGLGLGLSLVKAIVLAHHGDVEVESALGHGSVFTLRIPVGTDVTG
jgi:signal transduction histidine kinase